MKQKKYTKRALCMSLLSMLLCCSMLIGTTFAWFTDSVTSGNNKIVAGNLDIEMYWADGKENPDTVEWKDASTGDPIFDYELWEPGYTVVRHVKISNVGTLALKYEVRVAATGDVSKLADVIDVYYIKGGEQITDRSNLTDDNKIGTLTEVLSGTYVAKGHISGKDGDTVNSDVATIALKMQESAGNEYQGLGIGSEFDIHLVATQYTEEADSFGNDYDEHAPIADVVVATTAEMNAALKAAQPGESVGLIAGTYTLPETLPEGVTLIGSGDDTVVEIPKHSGASINVSADNVTVRDIKFEIDTTAYGDATQSQVFKVTGDNFTLEGCTFDCTGTNYTAVQRTSSAGDMTIKNCNFVGGFRQLGWCYGTKDSTTTIEGCNFSGGSYGIHFDAMNGSTVVVKDCVIAGWSSFGSSGGGNVVFEGTEFKTGGSYNLVRGYVDTTFTDCTFDNDFWFGAGNQNITVQFNSCKFDGSALSATNAKDTVLSPAREGASGKPYGSATENNNLTAYVDGTLVTH